MSGGRGTVVFLHAHPDDEAIFTGGTMALLAAAGWRLVLVVATHGEHGDTSDRVGPEVPLAVRRVAETAAAAEVLGVQRVEFLGYHDSGMPGHPANEAERAFARSSVDEAAERLLAILEEEAATALVTYDEQGVYGHPDHIQVHHVGVRAAGLAGLPTLYESTVDREYLHFVETHLVVEASRGGAEPAAQRAAPAESPAQRAARAESPAQRAARAQSPAQRAARAQAQPERGALGLAGTRLGLSTVEIDCTVDVRRVLEVKRRAMAAHASQIPETSSAMRLPVSDFAAVYGYEWYARRGTAGPIEAL